MKFNTPALKYWFPAHKRLIFTVVIVSFFSFKQSGKSKYGLNIISDPEEYISTLTQYPDKKLVRLTPFLKPFFTDIRYATANNFTHSILYRHHSLYLNKKAAEQLLLVQDSLIKRGYNLLVFDAYRPYSITEKMWRIVPDERYAASPAKGSGHNRGIAIDLSLIETSTGKPVPMPTDYDNFSDSAHQDFMDLQQEQIQNRELLKNVMEYFGFIALPTEWWHFSIPNNHDYPLYNFDFDQLDKLVK